MLSELQKPGILAIINYLEDILNTTLKGSFNTTDVDLFFNSPIVNILEICGQRDSICTWFAIKAKKERDSETDTIEKIRSQTKTMWST